ncbi:mRNA-decapping enzyme 1B [Trematomus bernacchii]|uniref:mRNA-decapping enzyme 1B n=1 Tax=Trematomus bernacchii TaxID=40690 RepID=UPI00146F22E7|nr:mRNA-decapping enzyme 1B [Trematomus bernacchii]
MTATSAGSSSCLTAKGLDISLAALQRQDPYINDIVDVASQVALYTYNNRANEWEKTEVEGTLFIYTRLASPRHGFTIMNRLSMENLTEPITKDLDFQLQHPFLLYRNARLVIHGIWFYDKEDCQRIAQRMKILTQQEQTLAQSQGGWLSPGGRGGVIGGGVLGGVLGGVVGGEVRVGGSEAKSVDIIQMLTKARTEYDKSSSEPKEIGGSNVIYGNPNLIKPIPVKPITQDGDSAAPKPLSLATLFGSQKQHSPKPEPVSPLASPGTGPSTGKFTRPPVARSLKYDDSVKKSVPNQGVNVAMVACSDGALRAVIGEHGGNVVGLLPNPTGAHHHPQHHPQQQQQHHHHPQQEQEQEQEQQQHCPAIQKLMQGQRGVGVVGGVLQTVSESPENRLCDNGVPLDHHHHHHHMYHHLHQQQHLHHQQLQQQQQQLQADPIKRLFQTQQPLPFSLPPLQQIPHLPPQPGMGGPVSCSHLQAQPSQQLFYSQAAPTVQAAGLLPSQVSNDQVLHPLQGLSSQMAGVVSPHELLQKLQLVQQEQASHDPPRPSPGLAPRFLGPTQGPGVGPVVGQNQAPATAGQKAALQFQVISPQRIPATVAPNLLLSPSVFTQAKSSGGLSAGSQENCPAPPSVCRPPPLQQEGRVLSRSQLQATMLHLIQSDGSFLDSIYEAYVSRFANDSSSKY